MAAITDFEDWLQQSEPANNEEAFHLYHALHGEESVGVYEVSKKNGHILVRQTGGADWLLLASPQAVTAFKATIDRYCPEPEMGWHGAEMYLNAMAKDD
jgi:hypothetical protein